jgi:pilus assembly protein CpaF
MSTEHYPIPLHPSEKTEFRPRTEVLHSVQRIILREAQQEIAKRSSDAVTTALSETELEEVLEGLATRLGYELSNLERDEILAQLETDQSPFGVLQELIDDPSISDIIISDFNTISVQQGRSNIKTSYSFSDQKHYDSFVEKLLLRAKTSYSTKKPIADGMIGEKVRVHAVHPSICESGPYLTLRINRFGSIDSKSLAGMGSAPIEVFEYFEALVKSGKTLLIVGEVGTGKTTLARAIANMIGHEESILVIEDTAEIRLDHPHVRYIHTRESNTDGEGRIAPSQCIRAGMRMAMNRIIFGEIRDAEAAESFIDVCASGHPGISTIHARSASEAVTRLELFLGRAQPGVGREVLSDQIATAVQAIVFVDVCPHSKKRRIMEVIEISGSADGGVRSREIFDYQFIDGFPFWKVVNRVSAFQKDFDYMDSGFSLAAIPAVLELDDNFQMNARFA